MIDDGLGFRLAPWTPSLERRLGHHVSGLARTDCGVDWSFRRKQAWVYSQPTLKSSKHSGI